MGQNANTPVEFYQGFHAGTRPLTRVISSRDFTYRPVLKLLQKHLKPGGRALDYGCGAGPLSLWLAAQGMQVLGVDLAPAAVDVARAAASQLGLNNAEFRCAQYSDFELSGGNAAAIGAPFDLIVCNQVIEHLPNDAAALRVLSGLLAPEGVFFLAAPARASPVHRWRMARAGCDHFDLEVGHLRRYTRAELATRLTECKIAVLEQHAQEGLLRTLLFQTPLGQRLNRFNKWPLCLAVGALDALTLPLGEASVVAIGIRTATAEEQTATADKRR